MVIVTVVVVVVRTALERNLVPNGYEINSCCRLALSLSLSPRRRRRHRRRCRRCHRCGRRRCRRRHRSSSFVVVVVVVVSSRIAQWLSIGSLGRFKVGIDKGWFQSR